MKRSSAAGVVSQRPDNRAASSLTRTPSGPLTPRLIHRARQLKVTGFSFLFGGSRRAACTSVIPLPSAISVVIDISTPSYIPTCWL